MHIPDGYLGPATYAGMFGLTSVFWLAAVKKVKKDFASRPLGHVPYLAMSAAFSFLIMMFNIPIPGGTTGHATGGAIIAILLGPWAAVLTVSIVLIVQALMFGDGGITSLGANCFNIAVAMPFVSHWVYKSIAGARPGPNKRTSIAAFAAGYAGLFAAAVLTSIELGIQTVIAVDQAGRPLYSPYPIGIALPVMAIEHLALFGPMEGMLTMAVLRYFMKHDPQFLNLKLKADAGP